MGYARRSRRGSVLFHTGEWCYGFSDERVDRRIGFDLIASVDLLLTTSRPANREPAPAAAFLALLSTILELFGCNPQRILVSPISCNCLGPRFDTITVWRSFSIMIE